MEFLIPSFLAGVLTILAPCALFLLPVILGGTASDRDRLKPLVITLSLGVSVFLFSLLLKATTLFIEIPNEFWRWISGGLIVLFGLTMLFPNVWNKVAFKLKLHKSEILIDKSAKHGGLKGGILLGASLGPVFTTCSPTYVIILAVVLPANFGVGVINLIAYTIGLMIPLLAVGYGGQAVVRKFRFAANPNGLFKKVLGTLLVVVGVFIFTGLDKTVEQKILEAGYFGPVEIEQSLLEGKDTNF
ncbi:MAG: cytochrome c biogenesis protein CcdA [Candidatus Peregrinibacteria bacterium]|nr:cytochrome c biogenesis protein CcdA [Candidatus Peregrinibacteria bacterium]